MTTSEPIRFFHNIGRFGFLSNYHACLQTVDGESYPTNEHYYQSEKTSDPTVKWWIRNAPSPWLAMKAGQALRPGRELRKDWNDKTRLDVMLKGLRAKFKNPEMFQLLAATHPHEILEVNINDLFWGIGKVGVLGNYSGQNHLGKLLVKVREEIRNDSTSGFEDAQDSSGETGDTAQLEVADTTGRFDDEVKRLDEQSQAMAGKER
jgi:ribA/ribD-fused uncharacterized protein